MNNSNTTLRFVSWIGLSILTLTGISILDENTLSGFGCIILAIFFIPSVFDKFNFSFAKSNIQRRLCKTAIAVIGFLIISMIGAFSDSVYENKIAEIKKSFNQANSKHELLSLIPSIDSSILDLPKKYHTRFDSIRKDIEVYKLYYSATNSFISSESIISRFSSSTSDSFEIGGNIAIALNPILNSAIVEKVRETIPTENDFPSREAYLDFRLKHSIRKEESEKAKFFFDEIIDLDRDYSFDLNNLTFAVYNFYEYEGYDDLIYNYVRRNVRDDAIILYDLSEKLYDDESYQRAYFMINRILKADKENKNAIRLAGHIAHSRKHNKTAVRHFEKLYDLGGLDRESCNILRDLTRYIYSWHYYSICCDGSRSESTGRGTCSHHGGICRPMKEPIYRYKYERCG